MRIAILDDYTCIATSVADWMSLGCEEVRPFHAQLRTDDEIVDALAGFDAVSLMRERTRISEDVLDRLPDLRLIVTSGMQKVAVDVEACTRRKIAVCGTDSLRTPTPELAFGFILSLMRQIERHAQTLRAGSWDPVPARGLDGSTLGIVGLGRMGSRVAALGRAFGMRVIAWSQNLRPEVAEAASVSLVAREELFAQSDVVSVHLVLSERTAGLIGADDFNLMKPSAYFVNTARAGIVDRDALIASLANGQIAGAGLDVHWEEPIAADDPFLDFPNVLLTPHIGYVTEQGFEYFYRQQVDVIAAYLRGEPKNLLNDGPGGF